MTRRLIFFETVTLGALCALVLCIVLGTGYVVYLEGTRALREKVDAGLDSDAAMVKAAAEQDIESFVEDMELWARQPAMIGILDSDADHEIADMLQVVAARSHYLERIECVSAAGHVIASTDSSRVAQKNPLGEALLREFGDGHRVSLIMAGGDVLVAVPITWQFDKPEFLGVLCATVSPEQFLPEQTAWWSALATSSGEIVCQRGASFPARVDPGRGEQRIDPWGDVLLRKASVSLPSGSRGPEWSALIAYRRDLLFGEAGVLRASLQRLALGASLLTLLLFLGFGRREWILLRRVKERARDLEDANASLRRSEVALRVATERAEEAARTKGEFLANMSHEIRTPMNGVLGFVDLLLDTEVTKEQREYLETVRISGETLLTVINDILDFSKIEAGKVEIETTEFELRALVEGVGDLLAPKAQEKGLEFICGVAAGCAPVFAGDATRIRQVLLNLASNAIKFTEKGEVTIWADDDADADGSRGVRFTVRDTGIGITREKLERLFQPFAQGDSSISRRYGGTGLGLVISQRLTHLMGGSMKVESEPGAGTLFTVRIPLEARPQAVSAPPKAAALAGLRVLVVDDNATNRMLLLRMLESFGCEPSAVSDAAAGLARLREAAVKGVPYSLALLDMQMPPMNGVTLARLVKADAAVAGTTLILLTSVRQQRSGIAREGLFAEILTKPIKQSALLEAIAHVRGTSQESAPEAHGSAPEDPECRPVRILLAEDNRVNQKVAMALLARSGHTVDLAQNGREALEAASQGAYDLILMDVQMPEMDGYEATEAIRAREAGGRHVPVIAMTARALSGDRELCVRAGMDDYLMKPVRPRELMRMIAKWAPQEAPAAAASGVSDVAAVVSERLKDLGFGKESPEIAEIIETFVTDSSAGIDAIAEALAAGDATRCEQSAHRLKGGASSIGFDDFAAAASALEQKGRDGALEGAGPLYERLRAQFEAIRRDASKKAA